MNNSQIVKSNSNQTSDVYCSMKAETQAQKVNLFNALEKCDFVLNDEVGQVIKLKHVYIQEYDKVDTNTGEPRKAHRTILFDEFGKTHVTASNYFFVCISKIFAIWGTPDTWSEPLTVKVVKKDVKNGRKALSLELVATESSTDPTLETDFAE